jgi:hypothetical protein
MPWVPVQMKLIYIARKQRKIKQREEKSSCFAREITRTNTTTPKKVLNSSLGEDGFLSSGSRQHREIIPRPKLLASEGRLQRQTPQYRKTVPGSNPSEGGLLKLGN